MTQDAADCGLGLAGCVWLLAVLRCSVLGALCLLQQHLHGQDAWHLGGQQQRQQWASHQDSSSSSHLMQQHALG